MEKRILIAGSGGQGIIFMGGVLSWAAMLQGREVTSFPSYGVEKIGGFAKCTVIISDEMIGSPVTESVDILIAMNQWGIDKFKGKIVRKGLLFYDSSSMDRPATSSHIKICKVPASEIVLSAKAKRGANMVMLGAFAAKTALVDVESLYKTLLIRTPEHRKESIRINRELLMKGYSIVEDKKG